MLIEREQDRVVLLVEPRAQQVVLLRLQPEQHELLAELALAGGAGLRALRRARDVGRVGAAAGAAGARAAYLLLLRRRATLIDDSAQRR